MDVLDQLFKDFVELHGFIRKNVTQLVSNDNNATIDLSYKEDNVYINLDYIGAHKYGMRGRDVMSILVTLLNKYGADSRLEVDTRFGSRDEDQLVKYYSRFSYELSTLVDDEGRKIMYRRSCAID